MGGPFAPRTECSWLRRAWRTHAGTRRATEGYSRGTRGRGLRARTSRRRPSPFESRACRCRRCRRVSRRAGLHYRLARLKIHINEYAEYAECDEYRTRSCRIVSAERGRAAAPMAPAARRCHGCGRVPARTWPSPGAEVAESRRGCGRVPAQTWPSPGADVAESRRRCGRVPAQMWASRGSDLPEPLRTAASA